MMRGRCEANGKTIFFASRPRSLLQPFSSYFFLFFIVIDQFKRTKNSNDQASSNNNTRIAKIIA